MAINTDLIKKSMALLAPKGTEITEYFYAYMFKHYPQVRPMFPKDMGPQAKRLLDSIVYIATNIDRVESLVPYLQKLGVGHNKYNTKPEHYPIVGESLLKTLEHFAGPAWTPELAKSWTEAYNVASTVMIEAAQKTAS
ncbi:MAG: globin domain-containing protein [Leptospirales bacterium]